MGKCKALFALAGLATIASLVSSTLHAGCDEKAVCDHIHYCAFENLNEDNRNDREHLAEALRVEVWSEIKAWTHNCQKHYGKESEWAAASDSCTPNHFIDIGRLAKAHKCPGNDQPPPQPSPGETKCGRCKVHGGAYTCDHEFRKPGTSCECAGKSGFIDCN